MKLDLEKLWKGKHPLERGNGKTTEQIIYFLHNIEFMFEEMCRKNMKKDFVVIQTIRPFIFNEYLKHEILKWCKELYPEYKVQFKRDFGIILCYKECKIDVRFCNDSIQDCDRGIKRENIFVIV